MRQEETIKYLDIIIDKRLNFNDHIDYTIGKCPSYFTPCQSLPRSTGDYNMTYSE